MALPYTDSPLGSLLTLLGQGIPALGQAHIQRGQQQQLFDQNLQQKQLEQQVLQHQVAEIPTQSAREKFAFQSKVDPFAAYSDTENLKQAGVPLSPDHIPFPLQRQQMIEKIMSGGSLPGQAGPAGPGGTPGGSAPGTNPQDRIALKLLFPEMSATEIYGPAVQRAMKVSTVDEQGNPIDKYMPASQVMGQTFQTAPTTAQRKELNDADQGLSVLAKIQQTFNPNYVGPAAGRWNVLQQTIPGFKSDPGFAEFYGDLATLKNATVRAITGAQMNKDEVPRIMAQIPVETDKPEVFQAKFKVAQENLQRMRGIIAGRQQGIPPTPPPTAATPQQGIQPAPTQQPPNMTGGLDAKLAKYAQSRGISVEQARALFSQIQ